MTPLPYEDAARMRPFSDAKIVDSWFKNALAWTIAVREKHIESRRLVTDQAIVDAILSRSPRSVLDIGCGEGWLARELSRHAIHVEGIDAIPELIQQAQNAGKGNFRVASYEDIAAGKFKASADTAVCNFALLGKQSVEAVFAALPSLLNPYGSFIVQALHPVVMYGDLPYQDGWRRGSWDGFSADFTDPAPWYFRTLGSWMKLFTRTGTGFRVLEIREPCHPKTHKPVSIIFIAEAAAAHQAAAGISR